MKSNRYTAEYQTLMMRSVELAALFAGCPGVVSLSGPREPGKRRPKRKGSSDPAVIRSQLNRANVDMLRERMKTLSGPALDRAKRTIEALEADI